MLRYTRGLTAVNSGDALTVFCVRGKGMVGMVAQKDMTIPQLARELGVSRVAVWNKVKSGKIPAHKVGSQYVIRAHDASKILGKRLTHKNRVWIHHTVGRVVRDYGPVLKKLSRE
jgi:excisionase family DNA binding protein